jgi:hypothetical protein
LAVDDEKRGKLTFNILTSDEGGSRGLADEGIFDFSGSKFVSSRGNKNS